MIWTLFIIQIYVIYLGIAKLILEQNYRIEKYRIWIALIHNVITVIYIYIWTIHSVFIYCSIRICNGMVNLKALFGNCSCCTSLLPIPPPHTHIYKHTHTHHHNSHMTVRKWMFVNRLTFWTLVYKAIDILVPYHFISTITYYYFSFRVIILIVPDLCLHILVIVII